MLFGSSKSSSLLLALRQTFGLEYTHAQSAQDIWIALAVAPGKRDGYYVDVGSADGEAISNSFMFDKLGWKGVCIDPFPTNMTRRSCQVVRQPVFSESGKPVRFTKSGEYGGITDTLNRHKENASAGEQVELVTATLDEILDKAKAPSHIDYMSIDIEGGEYEALRGLSLDRYVVDAFTIEHNYEQTKREAIRHLLEDKGYVRVRSWYWDDWYLRRELARRYDYYLEFSYMWR